MMWWLPVTRATLNLLFVTPGRLARHEQMALLASSHINRESQLVGRAELGDQSLKRLA
jgi:hypothetical protein